MTLKPLFFALTVLITSTTMVAPSTAADVPAFGSKGYEFKPHERQALKDYFLTLTLQRKVEHLGRYTVDIKHLLTVESLDKINSRKLEDNRKSKQYIVFRGKIYYQSPVKGLDGQFTMLSFKIANEKYPLLAFVNSNYEYGVTKFKTGESVDIVCKPKRYAPTSYQFDCVTYDFYANSFADLVTQSLVERVKTGDDAQLLDADGKAIAYAISAKEIPQKNTHCLFETEKCIKDVSAFLNGQGAKTAKSTLATIGIKEFNPTAKYNSTFSFEFDKSAFSKQLELNQKELALLASFYLEHLKGGDADVLKEYKINRADADTLVKTYDENEVEGDLLYLNKTLYITGKVAGIKSGISNKPYVVLKSKKMFQSPQLTFEEPNIDRLSKLRKGQNIEVVCKGGGEVVGTPHLRDCHFADDFFVKTAIIEAEYQNSKLKAAGKNIQHVSDVVQMPPFVSFLYPDDSNCLYMETINKCSAVDAIEEYEKKNHFPTLMYYGKTQLQFRGIQAYRD